MYLHIMNAQAKTMEQVTAKIYFLPNKCGKSQKQIDRKSIQSQYLNLQRVCYLSSLNICRLALARATSACVGWSP